MTALWRSCEGRASVACPKSVPYGDPKDGVHCWCDRLWDRHGVGFGQQT